VLKAAGPLASNHGRPSRCKRDALLTEISARSFGIQGCSGFLAGSNQYSCGTVREQADTGRHVIPLVSPQCRPPPGGITSRPGARLESLHLRGADAEQRRRLSGRKVAFADEYAVKALAAMPAIGVPTTDRYCMSMLGNSAAAPRKIGVELEQGRSQVTSLAVLYQVNLASGKCDRQPSLFQTLHDGEQQLLAHRSAFRKVADDDV
jgi:hypothetical protein